MANKKLKIGLIYGGKSVEREVSLNTAAQIKRNLDPEKYIVVPIEISAKGTWPKKAPLERLSKLIDIAFIAMHGTYGEDGKMQGLLETLGIPYTFSGVLASALPIDKFRAAMFAEYIGLKTPETILIRKSVWRANKKNLLKDIKKLGKKIVVKPNLLGSSVGVSIIKNTPMATESAIVKIFKYAEDVLVQEYISGKEITAAVLGNDQPKSLPLIEIIPTTEKGTFYDYEAKYSDGGSEHIIPAPLPKKLYHEVQRAAVDMHELLGCKGVTRSDFIVTKDTVYFLELNTIPGMTETSLVPQAAAADKISFSALLDKIIKSAK